MDGYAVLTFRGTFMPKFGSEISYGFCSVYCL